MARRKSPFGKNPFGSFDLPSMPKMPKSNRRFSDDNYADDDDRYITRDELNELERERAWNASPEGIAERQRNVNRDKKFWDYMLSIWFIRPYEILKFLLNKIFKRQTDRIGIGHFFSLAIWIIIVWAILEIYLIWEKVQFYDSYIINRLTLIVTIIAATYIYCKIKAWWKTR